MSTEILVALIALAASLLVAALTYLLTKRHEWALQSRRLREEYYRNFVKALSDVAHDNSDSRAVDRFSESINALTLVAGVKVVAKLMELHNFIRPNNTEISRDSPDWLKKHDALLTDTIRLMRADLFGKEEDAASFPPLHLVGSGKVGQA